jgi:hypothetical protein
VSRHTSVPPSTLSSPEPITVSALPLVEDEAVTNGDVAIEEDNVYSIGKVGKKEVANLAVVVYAISSWLAWAVPFGRPLRRH